MTKGTSQPLVSCIMPTYNRRRFVHRAILYFQHQNYPNKELIILDDGTDAIKDLVPYDGRIRYFRLKEKVTLGAKLNMACECARGQIIAHWDDDDWYASRRLNYQVETLIREGTEICGINNLLYYDIRRICAYRYIYPKDQHAWLLGSTLCYKKIYWAGNRFAEIDVGMDGLFVRAAQPHHITNLDDSTFSVFMIHQHNVSPKKTTGAWWHAYPVEEIRKLLNSDWEFYRDENGITLSDSRPVVSIKRHPAEKAAKPVRNIFACLVHESQECVIDLVRNLRYHDHSSLILLYNGGEDENLLNLQFPFEQYGVVVHPSPRRMAWGRLHRFALDCMQFALDNFQFDTLTIVDSDQLAVNSGFSEYLGNFVSEDAGIGLLGNSPDRQPNNTNVAAAAQALKETDLWRPLLRRFACGEDKFVYWTFWPSTIFLADAARDLTRFFSTDDTLQRIMRRSSIWATEEVVLPTLAALLGYKIRKNPCSYDYVRYQTPYTVKDVDSAIDRADVFWLHPIPRQYANRLRCHVRNRFDHYQYRSVTRESTPLSASNNNDGLLLTTPILKTMSKIEGWLEEEEADLLIAASRKVMKELPQPHSIVEVGSYKGRSTVVLGSVVKAVCPEAKVYAIDPHDGKVGAMDQGVQSHSPTLNVFNRNIENAGLADVVKTVQSRSVDVSWDRPISFLFIDGLHDYPNVARDFWHFHKSVRSGGIVAFHDYAEYYPGVMTFVDEVLRLAEYRLLKKSKSLVVLEKGPQTNCEPLGTGKLFRPRS